MTSRHPRFPVTARDLLYAFNLAVASLIAYLVVTRLLASLVDYDNRLLGGMWAVVATVFVFKETGADSIRAGLQRLLATGVSFVLCLLYLLVLPFSALGLALLLALGTLIMMLLRRHDDIVTTGITTAVVMVVAGLGAADVAWQQPLLRLVDTIVGIAVGVSFRWLAYDRQRRHTRP